MDATLILYAAIGGGLGGGIGGVIGSALETKFAKPETEKNKSAYYLVPFIAFILFGWQLLTGLYRAGILPKFL